MIWPANPSGRRVFSSKEPAGAKDTAGHSSSIIRSSISARGFLHCDGPPAGPQSGRRARSRGFPAARGDVMSGTAGRSSVEAWSERVVIPTYTVGEPDRNPMFLEKRVYQGSSGAVYPHPVIDRIEGR